LAHFSRCKKTPLKNTAPFQIRGVGMLPDKKYDTILKITVPLYKRDLCISEEVLPSTNLNVIAS
jgi:hypothetical protein